MITTAFPETPGQAGTVITSMSAVGGMIIPWLQGVVMQQSGIRAGTYMIAILVALIIVSFGVNQWAKKRV